jgi:hypothetical protein
MLTNSFRRCCNLLFFYRIVKEQKLLVKKWGTVTSLINQTA